MAQMSFIYLFFKPFCHSTENIGPDGQWDCPSTTNSNRNKHPSSSYSSSPSSTARSCRTVNSCRTADISSGLYLRRGREEPHSPGSQSISDLRQQQQQESKPRYAACCESIEDTRVLATVGSCKQCTQQTEAHSSYDSCSIHPTSLLFTPEENAPPNTEDSDPI